MNSIEKHDPDVWAAIAGEIERQRDGLEMIASENYTSPAVMQCMGSVLTNKYAEGYPGRRYYGGCEYVDVVEDLARNRAKQTLRRRARQRPAPLRGPGQYGRLLRHARAGRRGAGPRPGPRRAPDPRHEAEHLGQALPFLSATACGATRTASISTRWPPWPSEHKPKLIVAGASAYPREIPHGKFAEIARECGAKLFVDMAHYAGLVAAGLHDNPVPVADFVTTTTHKTLRGPRGGMILCKEAYAKDIDRAVFPGIQGGPLMHVIAGKAVCFGEALAPAFKAYIQQVIDNAKTLAEVLAAGGVRLVSGGTDNHLMLADVTPLGLSGGQAEEALGRCGITVNKNMIPFDQRKPMDPSGIRIGTPAMTSRGMGCGEMRTIGGWILEALRGHDQPAVLDRIRGNVRELCKQFPVPADGT